MKQPLTVLGFGAVAPYTRADAQPGSIDAKGLPKLDLALLERTLRRGLSEVTRLFMHAAKLALDDAGREAEHMHVIFASAFGEIATAEALLALAYDANGSSPARFRNSVHNTAAGLLSISTKNRLACTAVAAGWETVPMALFEARAQLSSQAETVLLVFAEEPVPNALSAEHQHGPLAAAFVLAREATPGVLARGSLVNLRRKPRSELSALASIDGLLDQHPLSALPSLVEALSPANQSSLTRPRARIDGGREPRDASVSERTSETTLALSDGANPWCIDVHTRGKS